MKRISFFLVLLFFYFDNFSQTKYLQQWPTFRGPFAKGYIEKANTIIRWNLATGENIIWQTSIPGLVHQITNKCLYFCPIFLSSSLNFFDVTNAMAVKLILNKEKYHQKFKDTYLQLEALGHSSPVIWNDKMFVTTAISGSGTDELKVGLYGDIDAAEDVWEHEFKLYCIDKNTGEIIWDKLVYKGVPKVKRHTKASHADCTPATDGKHIVAFFGSQGLCCFDYDGKLLWQKDFGKMNAGPYSDPDFEWGFSSSPIIYKGSVIVQCDFLGDCFLASYDVKTSVQNWLTPRDEVSTWCTPTVFEKDGKTQIVVNGWKHMGGYDFATGREIWKMSGGGDAPAPTPVIAHNLIFINNAHGRYAPIYAVKTDAVGDITLGEKETSNEYIVWSVKRGGAYMQTPLIHGDYLYNLQGNGSLSVYKATNGERMYKESLGSVGGFTASGVAANGRVYFCSERGDVFVVKAGPVFEVLAHNSMDDILMASPAISEDVLYFRAQKSLIAVGKK